MKKAFCLSLIVMFFALAGLTPVKADDVAVVTPYVDIPTLSQSEIDQYTYSTMLMEYLRQGGTIDVKNKSDNYTSYDLIEDFGNFIEDVIGVVTDVINPFQSEFQWGTGYPLNKATPATLQFMGLLPFYALSSEEPEPTPTPDAPVNLVPYIEKMNSNSGSGEDFFWSDFPDFTDLNGNISGYTNLTFPWTSYSYINTTMAYPIVRSTYLSSPIGVCPVTDVFIFSNGNNTYSFSTVFNTTVIGICPPSFNFGSNLGYLIRGQFQKTQEQRKLIWTEYQNYNSIDEHSRSYTLSYQNHTLEDCFAYLSNNVRNVNIYVDNVLYAYAGNGNVSYNIELSTSTVTPTGERVRWMYDKEIYVDMDKIIEKLDEILETIDNTPNTPTIIKFDDLQDVIVDVDGQPAIAVKVLQDDKNIDELYLATYGPIIPAFLPLFTPVIDDVDIIAIADTAVSPIPSDLLEVFGYMFMGVLFVGFIHRLLE